MHVARRAKQFTFAALGASRRRAPEEAARARGGFVNLPAALA